MNLNNRAVSSHIYVLLIVAFVLSVLMTTVFSPIFANDHEKCQNIDYKITSKSKTDGGISLNIENIGNSKIYFQFNGENDLKKILQPKKELEYRVHSKEEEFNIIPLYVEVSGKVHECKGKKTTLNKNTLI